MGLTYKLQNRPISPNPNTSVSEPSLTNIPHEKLVNAIKAFLRIEPGVEATPENVEIFDLINKYFNPAVTLEPAQIQLLYRTINKRLMLSAGSTLAEEYIEDLGIAPFPRYDDFVFSRWRAAVPHDQLELFQHTIEIVRRSELFKELPGEHHFAGKATHYIAAAFAEKGIQPEAVVDRIYAVTRGSRHDAIATGLWYA
ncbi:hypothetical protein HGRIS_007305 [Hohenbuehelia grisea]|uniref:Uncharacterized protein n=1 Tax=Hohenbuehelia grisea TaxID=104357 RepID=A0ABR3J4D6_9AGAR